MRQLVWTAGGVRCVAPLDALSEVVPAGSNMPVPGAPVEIRGLIQDSNLDYWRLELARGCSGEFAPLAGGETPRAVRSRFWNTSKWLHYADHRWLD